MSFDYLNVFKPNKHTQDYHIRKPKKIFLRGRKSFESNDIIVKYSLDLKFNDIKFPYAYGENNIYYMLHQKYIRIQEYELSTLKKKYECLYKKDEELKGDVLTDESEGIIEYGNVFRNCKVIQDGD